MGAQYNAAAIRIETGTPDTSPGSLVALVRDEVRRASIQVRLVREGLRDSDLRVLSEAAGLSLYRATWRGEGPRAADGEGRSRRPGPHRRKSEDSCQIGRDFDRRIRSNGFELIT